MAITSHNDSPAPAKHNLETTVNYYDDPGDGSPPTPVYVGSKKVTNERPMVATLVTVFDVTGDEDTFTLDQHGFQFHTHASAEKVFDDESRLAAEYFPECERMVQNITGAALVAVFDHKVRRGPTHWHKLGEGNTASRGPLHRAHVDQSYDGAVLRLRESFPKAAVPQGRWQIINVWRPIRPIRKDPLAFADASTVADADLVAASIIYPSKRSESWTVKPNPAHRWYFKYGQAPDEVVLIKCFDSETGVARRVPHCAVEDPEEVDSECRESVEVRCLVFYEA